MAASFFSLLKPISARAVHRRALGRPSPFQSTSARARRHRRRNARRDLSKPAATGAGFWRRRRRLRVRAGGSGGSSPRSHRPIATLGASSRGGDDGGFPSPLRQIKGERRCRGCLCASATGEPEALGKGPVDQPAASHLRSSQPAPLPPAAPASPSANMNKRRRTAVPEARTTMLSSYAVEFKVDYEQTKDLAPGKAIHSDAILAGGHIWRIYWYPRGIDPSGCCVSMMVKLMSNFGSAKALVGASLMKPAGITASKGSFTHVFQTDDERGWPVLLIQKDLLSYVIDGQITAYCTITVLHDSSFPVLPSDIGKHFGELLDSTDGVDVSFIVEGETFHAHRTVLAARSPVFRAELLGSMSEARMSSITLHDIAPATFRIMLRFMYTDAIPGDDELGDSPTEMFKHLLAAADRYALDRLKNMCARKLWENVSVDTVGDALACAEIYNCPELKSKCIDFVVAEKNFKKVVLTESFMRLGLKFPSVIAEVQERVGT